MDYLLLVLSYLIGSVPFALIVGKGFYQIDIREHGSGNLGATNTFRTLGKKAGIIVMILDVLKGTLAMFIVSQYAEHFHILFLGSAAVIGHCYPIFAKFRGGKAVATSSGIILFYFPILFVTSLVVFLLILKISKYVSLSSMVASFYMFIFSLFTDDIYLMGISLFLFVFIVYRHRDNIKRIKNKTERKVNWI